MKVVSNIYVKVGLYVLNISHWFKKLFYLSQFDLIVSKNLLQIW